MTYYEELGISQTASHEDIRHAYRQLARLIHPDHFLDEESRRLADLQMKRLNGIALTLGDPERRNRYDASQRGGCDSVHDSWIFQLLRRRRLLSVGGTALALMTLIVVLRQGRQHSTIHTIAVETHAPAPSKTTSRHAVVGRPALVPRVPTALQVPEPPELDPSRIEIPPAAIPVAIAPVLIDISLLEAQLPPLPRPPRLAGNWLFVPSRQHRQAGYPPSYIELRLSEDGGVLHGVYHARYQVSDRAISPNVAFRFDGRARPDGGVLAWQGPAGSHGEVTLRLLPVGVLEVDWVAHELGQELGLISGSATLVRKLE